MEGEARKVKKEKKKRKKRVGNTLTQILSVKEESFAFEEGRLNCYYVLHPSERNHP